MSRAHIPMGTTQPAHDEGGRCRASSREGALEGLHRGSLTVLVDSAPHRFQLRTLLDGGLKRQIQARFGGALNRIRVMPGQFYSVDVSGRRRYQF